MKLRGEQHRLGFLEAHQFVGVGRGDVVEFVRERADLTQRRLQAGRRF